MSENTNRRTWGGFLRHLVLLPVLILAVGVAFAGTASAQTAFQANVSGHAPMPVGCGDAFFCGTANIAGYGTASWNWVLDSLTPGQTNCDSTYTATVHFTLASGSVLELNESGNVCAHGKNGVSIFNPHMIHAPKSYGNPSEIHGTWSVDTATSTGQFEGLNGSGTDDIRDAGAHASGSYTGTLS